MSSSVLNEKHVSNADFASDLTNPTSKINKMFEVEKKIIYSALKDKDYRKRLLSIDQTIVRSAIEELLEKEGFKFKLDPNVRYVFHENNEDELHFAIPIMEANDPVGY